MTRRAGTGSRSRRRTERSSRPRPVRLSGYEHLEAVFLDDLDTVAGDAAWESALFTLHNELQEHGGRMVATARMPPAKLP